MTRRRPYWTGEDSRLFPRGSYVVDPVGGPTEYQAPHGTGLLDDPERARRLMDRAFDSILSASPEVTEAAVEAVRLQHAQEIGGCLLENE